MSRQIAPITELQLNLITRAHCDAGGLIEPLLALKGGAKLKMIASLASRSLIEQVDGQWRITRAAVAIVKGAAQPQDDLPATPASTSESPLANDPGIEAAVTAAEASWQNERPTTAPTEPAKRGRADSKQALVIEMLKCPEGATIPQISETPGWQAHTVRGTFAGALKKKLGLTIVSDKAQGGERVYRIA